MFVLKSKISNLIKKERQKERAKCEKEYIADLQEAKEEMETEKNRILKETRKEYQQIILQKNNEIKKLNQDINKNYGQYREIRTREQNLDLLTSDIETVVDNMVIKVQESLQPFYRTRSKVELTKRKSDRKHEKVENIFRAAK